jgi:hypothetical protein
MCTTCQAFYFAQLILNLKRSPSFINGFLIDTYGPLAAEDIMAQISAWIVLNEFKKPMPAIKPRCACDNEKE